MTLSIAGLLVCAVLLALGAFAGMAVIAGFFASLPFGSTSIATLDALGGSSPQIYVVFLLLLIGSLAIRRTIFRDLGAVFWKFRTAWLLLILMTYTLAGALILPRLFMGVTSALIPIFGVIQEAPLAPVSGNITQPAYFSFHILSFFAFSVILFLPENFGKIKTGFMILLVMQAFLGFLELGGKLVGVGDILSPLRTASYAMLTEVEQSGFFRITGAYPEASAFASSSLGCLAFAFTYWRATGSVLALVLAFALLVLLLLSTSSTAYVGLCILLFAATISFVLTFLRRGVKTQDLIFALTAGAALTTILALTLYNGRIFNPFLELLQTMVFDKAISPSGRERAYWNAISLQSFWDTGGLGVGMGSSRASSWLIATLSQLGLIGSAMVAALVAILVRGLYGIEAERRKTDIAALASAARALALANLMALTLIGGTPDPGPLFFVALAVLLSAREHLGERRQSLQGARSLYGRRAFYR